MHNYLKVLILSMALLLLSSSIAHAGGPLVVSNGKIISYGDNPLIYRYDKGMLGKFTNAEIVAIIEDLFSDWENIPTANVKFQQDSPGFLDEDINETNFLPILEPNGLLGYTPIVFDEDGELTEALLGAGTKNAVLGFAGPREFSSMSPIVILESQAVYNGRFINGIDSGSSDRETSVESLMGTIIHETGHAFGLDHSQINVEAISPTASLTLRESVPLMFPVAVNDLFLIRRDDASAASLLHPDESALAGFGSIEGSVFRQNGSTPVLGANVIARNVNDPQLEAVSCVSDYLTNNTGSYKLFALPPGDYTLEIEPIDVSFTGGSGVGPYSQSEGDISFQNPVPSGFYTGPGKPITTNENLALTISVAAGQTVTGANIVASTSGTSTSSSSTSGGSTTSSTSSSSSGTGISESEPNDSQDQAQIVTIPATISGNAAFGDPGDIELETEDGLTLVISDLFKFTLSEATTLKAKLTNESSSDNDDLDLILLDANGPELALTDNSSLNGNANELINTALPPGTYLLGIGAFSGSTSYVLEISTVESPTITLSGPETVIVSDLTKKKNKFKVQVDASNFMSKSKCEVIQSDNITAKIKPKKFKLNHKKTRKKLRVKIPFIEVLDLVESDTQETLTISVFCTNGANDIIDILITPSSDDLGFKINDRKWNLRK